MFSDRLKNLMIAQRMNISTLSEKLDIPEKTIEKWLTGEVDPTMKISKLCDILDCSGDFLLGFIKYNNKKLKNDIYAQLSYHENIVTRLKREIREREEKFDFLVNSEMEYFRYEDTSYVDKINRRLEREHSTIDN